MELQPELAQSWESSPDGLTHTFHLVPGVTWHNVSPVNGRPFVADDVVYAYQRYTTSISASYLTNMASVTAPDAATVRIQLKRPAPDFLVPLGGRFLVIFPREVADSGSMDKVSIGT